MKKSIVAIVMVVLSCMPAAAQERLRLCPMHSKVKNEVTVPVDLQSGVPVVNVYFGEKGPYRFMLDTSVKCALIVDKGLAKELALPHRGAEKILNPATRTMSPYEIVGVDRVSLGSAQFDGSFATVDDVRGPFGVDGIVGFGLFGQVLASLDFANHELRISRGALPSTGLAIQTLKLLDGVPSLVVEAGDQYLFASVNTGVPVALTVPKQTASSLAIAEKRLKGELRIGTAKLTAPRVAAIDNFALPNVGNEFLTTAKVTFDTAHGRVAVEPAVRQ
jgi:hypothetical protein